MCVSIIIPTYNRCDALVRTLDSLAQMDVHPEESEVVIVDNGSTDRTRQAVEHAATRCSKWEIRYFFEPVPGLLSGRHRGALEAHGELCVFLDDDIRVDPGWLDALVEGFRDPNVVLVGGPSQPFFESPPPEWLDGFYTQNEHVRCCGWLSLLDGGDRVKEVDPCYVWGLNYAIRRKQLFDLGGFHPDCIPKPLQRFQGDGETGLNLKIRQAGMKVLYHPYASVQHEIPASRLTVEYTERRAFYQGVCDSYTRIRSNRAVEPEQFSWKTPLRQLKHFIAERIDIHRSLADQVRWRTSKAYSTGYAFHQGEVRRDPNLLAWVLRETYWDYRLPEGWEHYCSTEDQPGGVPTLSRAQAD